MTSTTLSSARNTQVLLRHLARYRLTEFSVLKRLPEFRRLSPAALHQQLRQARQAGVLESAPLHQSARYWYLTPDGAAQAELPPECSGPLSESAKLRAYAVLRFCFGSRSQRHRLDPEELKQQFPLLARGGLPNRYYYDPREGGHLGLYRVDAGGSGRWDRCVQAVRQDISSHLLNPGFRQLVQAGRFRITVLTVFHHNANRLAETLREHRDTRRIPVECLAFPELLPLIAPVSGRR